MTDFSLSLVDNLGMSIAVVTETGSIVYANNNFRETFGDRAASWIESAARTVGGERGWLQGFFVSGDDRHSMEVDFDGRVYHVERVPADNTTGVALIFDDVTRQREAEQAKSDFTSMIVHDLRGPLSGIQGTLDFIINGENTSRFDPMHEELMREAMRESERMMSLINELLDFSKIESGNFEVEKEPVRIAGVLKRAVVSLQSIAQRDEVNLISAHGSELPGLTGSTEKLTQAVINLVSNALKFTPKKGVISVGAQVNRDADGPVDVVITVTDSGVGMKAEDLGKIFEKYKQTKNKSLRGGGGTGLGLYIVKQVLEAHGGEVKVASLEGVGTCMVLRVPVRRVA
jgi:two-component system, OmpR family, phosphate regulon sensor histidine kinase PhoR